MKAALADMVEPARIATLQSLGEGDRAFGLATSWLSRKLNPASPG